ncbi:MAG: chain length determinant protein EpsF [Burkholderiales bacterium]|nr:chain length determinant protein EpsF [Burkholderiales bacterium]
MTFSQFLLILKARFWTVLVTLALVVAVTVGVSLVIPKEYTANTAIVVDVKSPDPVAGMVLPALIAPGYMATQVDIINSDRVAQRVVKMLKLDESPSVRQQWQEATEGKGNVNTWLAELLQKKLDVRPSRESNVINIGFRGADPKFAAAVANAFAQAYIDVNLELKVEPARQYATWFEGQVKQARAQLEKAQLALTEFTQRTGIVAAEERLDFENNKLSELSMQLSAVQAQTADSASKQKSGAKADTLAEVMQNPLLNQLKADIARLEGRLKDSNVNLGKNHPQTQRAEEELASLRSKLDAETKQVTSSIGTTLGVNRQKEQELRAAIAAQKARVLELNKTRDEINVLKRDFETAQRNYELVSVRSSQTKLESTSVQTNIAVLNAAPEPIEPSRPRMLLNAVVAVFLGIFLGVGLAFMRELANRRVRSAEDLSELIGLPLLATIPKADLPGRSFFGPKARAA